tara:strand:- start:97 stop:366 length:270 start_codon:yes stop_codon:yes gene_type:complete
MKFTERQMSEVSATENSVSISTHGCGCCSYHYTTHPERHSSDFTVDVNELVKYVEKEQKRLNNIKEYVESVIQSGIKTIIHKEENDDGW